MSSVYEQEEQKPTKKDRFSFRSQRKEKEEEETVQQQTDIQPEPVIAEDKTEEPVSFVPQRSTERLLNDIVNNLNSNASASTVDQIESEISEDARNMGTLLSDIFYTASGINNYCMQEFERIRREVYLSKNLFWSLLYDACNDGMINDFEINFKEKEIIYRQYLNLIRSYEKLK